MDHHAPFITISRKKLKQKRKSWITDGIVKSVSVWNKYYTKFLETKDGFRYQHYNYYYRDMINHLIRKSKRKYSLSYLNKFKHNSKKVWSGISNILDLKKYQSNCNICLNIGGRFITSQAQVANKFNDSSYMLHRIWDQN